MKKIIALLAMMLVAPAMALDVQFSGTVSTTCTLTLNQSGVLAINPSNPSLLSTSTTGGSPAIVGVNFLGTPTVSVTIPSAFTTAPTMSFTPTTSGNVVSNTLGALTVSNGTASGTYSTSGSDLLTLSLSASGGGTPFPTGSYIAVSVVTCS